MGTQSTDEVIAKFMNLPTRRSAGGGRLYIFDGVPTHPAHLKFSTSWDWLIEAARAVKTFNVPEQTTELDQVEKEGFCAKSWEKVAHAVMCLNMEMTYAEILDFARWVKVNIKPTFA